MSTIDGSARATARPGLHRFAIVCVAATFILVFVGGLVTSTGSALAVPDWPLAFGQLIPELSGGVRFEWSHRAIAGIVSILTLILAVWTWKVEARGWVRNIALAAFALIVAQAVLGGITVLLLLPLPIAVAHAAVGQAFFCLMVVMALVADPNFAGEPTIGRGRERPRLTTLTAATTAIIYVQILLGAVMRHLGAGLAIPDFPTSFGHLLPPFASVPIAINFAHRCGAVVVSFFVLWTVVRIVRLHANNAPLRRSAIALLALLIVQLTLGALTIWSGRAVLPTTAHVAIGAVVLAMSLTATVRAYAATGLATVAQPAKVPAPMIKSMEGNIPA